MAFIQKTTPPPNKVLSFSMKNFVGGLNNRSEQIGDNQASSLMNMRFIDETVMDNRYGQKYYDALTLDAPVVFIDEYKPYSDANVTIRCTEGKLYINENILTTLSGKPCCINHSGRYYIVDGTNFYVYGKFPQVTSTYEKVVGTPINDYVLLQIVSPTAGYTRLDTSHVKGVLNVDYTNYKVWYEPCQNEFTDTYSGENVVPTGVKYIVSHNGRLYASGDGKDDDNVFITDVQNPFYFPVSLPMQLPPNSDQVVGMIVYDNAVVIGRHNDVYAIYGATNNPNLGADVFSLHKLNTHTGFANHDAVRVAHNYLLFLGDDGNCYSLTSVRNDQKVLATSVITRDVDITKDPINLLASDIYTATSCFFDDKWYLSIKDKVLVYSYEHQAWTVYNKMNARSFYVLNHELIWGTPEGRTAMFDKENYLDFGLPYQSYWYSKRFDMGEANSFKQFRDFYVVAHTFDTQISDISLLFEIDYVDVNTRVVISNQISVFGRAKWGDRFITRNINESLPFTIGRRGRSIKFKLSCGYDKNGEVATYNDLLSYIGTAEGVLVYVIDESSFYLYIDHSWMKMTSYDLAQHMKVYQINGDYELRGKR